MFKRAIFGWIRNALAVFGLLFAVVTATPLVGWWADLLARPWHGPEGDVLIVLAGSHQGDVVGESSYLRALYAVRAYRQCRYRKLLVSGFQSAEAMRDFMAGQGIPPERVEIEPNATTTLQNVQLLTPALKRELAAAPGTRFVLLTSDYHVNRSIRLFRKAGFAMQTFPAPDALKRAGFPLKRWTAFLDLCQETVKIGYYQWRGWL